MTALVALLVFITAAIGISSLIVLLLILRSLEETRQAIETSPRYSRHR